MGDPVRAIRAVGRNLAFETGIRVGLSLCARLLLGYLGGLPTTALSVNASIAFLLSAVLELPAGMLADTFGARRSVHLGYACQAAASLSLFGAIALRAGSPWIMWLLIVAEAVFDAVGNSLLSGARESAYQGAVEASLEGATGAEKTDLRRKYLLLAEAYGRRALVAVPLALTAIVLWLDAHGGRGHLGLLLVVACWLLLDRQFQGMPAGPVNGVRPDWAVEARRCLAQLRGHGGEFAAASFCWMVNRFAFITVTSYFAVAVIKDEALWPARTPAAPAMLLTAAFLAGRVARSFVLPFLAKSQSSARLITGGAAAQALLAAAVLAGSRFSGPAYLGLAAVALAAYDICAGTIERPSLGLILEAVPEKIRASFLSMLSMCVLAAQGAYSLYLAAHGRGLPSVRGIWLITLASGVLILASRLKRAKLPLEAALG